MEGEWRGFGLGKHSAPWWRLSPRAPVPARSWPARTTAPRIEKQAAVFLLPRHESHEPLCSLRRARKRALCCGPELFLSQFR